LSNDDLGAGDALLFAKLDGAESRAEISRLGLVLDPSVQTLEEKSTSKVLKKNFHVLSSTNDRGLSRIQQNSSGAIEIETVRQPALHNPARIAEFIPQERPLANRT